MNGLFLIFILAVILWALLSIVLIIAWQNKNQTTSDSVASKDNSDVQTKAAIYEAPDDDVENLLLQPPGTNSDWQQELNRLPGLLGWIMIYTDGTVLDFSGEEFKAMGATLAKMIETIQTDAEKLGINPIHLLEWESPQGSILIVSPEDIQAQTKLILFLGTETYKSWIREFLSQLRWEPTLKGESIQ